MTIETVNVLQQGYGKQSQQTQRKIELATNRASEPSLLKLEEAKQRVSQTLQINTASTDVVTTHHDKQQSNIYERPISPKLALLKQLVEQMTGKEINLAEQNVSDELTIEFRQAVAEFEQQNTSDQGNIVTVDGRKFNAQQQLLVAEKTLVQQQLAYDMQGSFTIEGQQHELSLSLNYQHEFSILKEFEITAAELVDPLLVQYGKRTIGEVNSSVEFNLNEQHQQTNLPMFSGDVGYLVYDKNTNGKADDGSELFGPTTNHGFNELAELDDNGDGFISKNDAVFDHLYLWQDGSNGRQWLSLADANIEAIYLTPTTTPYNFYDDQLNVQAQIRQTSFAISSSLGATAVHQIDINV